MVVRSDDLLNTIILVPATLMSKHIIVQVTLIGKYRENSDHGFARIKNLNTCLHKI